MTYGCTSAVDTLVRYGYLLECHARNEPRRAVAQYERAFALDPDADKPVWQLIRGRAGLREPERAVAFCEQHFAASRSVRGSRFLATAYLAAGKHAKAQAAIDAGLALDPEDATLFAIRGELRAATDDPDGALSDWRRALELDDSDIGALYSTAFLLERRGRVADAADAWREIIAWLDARGFVAECEWPRRELERLTT